MTTPIWDELAPRYSRLQSGDPLNPDCIAGKHAACAGDAWNHEADEPARCACPCHVDDQADAITQEAAA